MRATVVKVTGRSAGKDGISKELNYIGDGTTPAHDITILPKSEQHQLLYRQRNIILDGVGVDTTHGITGVKADFQRLAHKKPGVKVKTTNLVIAPQPGTVNPHDYEQVSRFRDFCERYAKAVFPHHLAYIAIQMDNGKRYVPDEWTPGKLHAHVIVSNLSNQPPYKAMRGNDYGILRLRRLYDQQALIFNHRQNAIHLGPSEINDGSVHLTQYEKLLTRKLQPVLDKADHGAYHTRTDFKFACRAQGVKLRFSSFKHRKYVVKTNSNGKHYKRYIYRRYRQGKKKGRLMYRKTKRGRHKIPVYTHTYGVSFWLPKAQHNHKLTRIRGSKLGKYDGRLNYKHINFDIQHARDIHEARAEEQHNDTEPVQQQKPTDFADYYAKDSADMGWAAMASADNIPVDTSYASSAYSSEISVASTAVRTHGVDLASMTPKPLSSASYSPEVEIALASVGASVSSANGTTLSNINNFENAFGADTDEMAIARENRIAERNEARRKSEAARSASVKAARASSVAANTPSSAVAPAMLHNINNLENLYQNPIDRNEIRQLIPVYYLGTNNPERYHKLIKYPIPCRRLSNQSLLKHDVARYVKYYRNEIIEKIRRKSRDVKDRATVALDDGFHQLMNAARKYVPESFQRTKFFHLKTGIKNIIHSYDKTADAARQRVKTDNKIEKQQDQRRAQQKRAKPKVDPMVAIHQSYLRLVKRNQRKHPINHIHRGGPTLG